MENIFNSNLLKDEGKAELSELLESLRGRKCLVLDIELGDLMNQMLIEGTKILRENGVSQMKELRGDLDFGSDLSRDVPDSIIYFVRPNLSSMKIVAKQVRNCIAAGIWISHSALYLLIQYYIVKLKSKLFCRYSQSIPYFFRSSSNCCMRASSRG